MTSATHSSHIAVKRERDNQLSCTQLVVVLQKYRKIRIRSGRIRNGHNGHADIEPGYIVDGYGQEQQCRLQMSNADNRP